MARRKVNKAARGVVVRYRSGNTPETIFHSAAAVLELINKRGDNRALHEALAMLDEPETSTHRVADLPANKDTIRRLLQGLYTKINEQQHPWHGYPPLEFDPQDNPREAVQEVQAWCLENMERADRERVLGETRTNPAEEGKGLPALTEERESSRGSWSPWNWVRP